MESQRLLNLSNQVYFLKKKVIACGNIGLPIGDVIKKSCSNDIFVIEASSFQLDKIFSLKFDISILLNISKDHLDWHGNFRNYINSKLNIFKNQNKSCFSIICIDDSNCRKIAKLLENIFLQTYKN